MEHKSHIVVRDMCHEVAGTPSTVGKEVVAIAFIPKNTPLSIFDRGFLVGVANVNKDVYLCSGADSRFVCRTGQADITVVVNINDVLFCGNDFYSAEELGITE